MLTVSDLLLMKLLKHAGNRLRVDTHTGPCQWYEARVEGRAFMPISSREIWRLTIRTAKFAGIHATYYDIIQTLRLAQAHVPILTFEEWCSPVTARINRPRWAESKRAA